MSHQYDRIEIEGLVVDAPVGVYPHERTIRQRLVVDLALYADLRPAGESDRLSETIDYDQACRVVREVASSKHHELIETIAESVATRILSEVPRVERIRVRVAKPGAVPDARTVAVAIERERGPRT